METLECKITKKLKMSGLLNHAFFYTGPGFRELKNGEVIQKSANYPEASYQFRPTTMSLYRRGIFIFEGNYQNDTKVYALTDHTAKISIEKYGGTRGAQYLRMITTKGEIVELEKFDGPWAQALYNTILEIENELIANFIEERNKKQQRGI
jgi:hypothetical protein